MPEEVIDAPAVSSPAPDGATDPNAQGVTEDSPASGVQAEPSPAADSEFAEFSETVKELTGQPDKTETKPEDEPPAKPTDEPAGDKPPGTESDVLSAPGTDVPNVQRPEWQKLTSIAGKVGPQEKKEVQEILREFYRREHEFGQQIDRLKPAGDVVQEMLAATGGDRQGFDNMRHLIRSFDSDPAGAVPMLEVLLGDARKRAGLVLQSPELVGESQAIDQQVKDGLLEPAAAEKRKKELLELESARVGLKRTQAQIDAQKQQQERQSQTARNAQAVEGIQRAAEAWEKDKLAHDPDYAPLKALHTSRTFMLAEAKVQQLGRMLTPTEATAVADEALKQVKEEVGKLVPRKTARTAIVGSSNGSSGNNRQQPASELDEFKNEVEAAVKRYRR